MPSDAQMSEMHGEGYIVGQIFLKINERATPQKMEKEKIKKERRRRKETGERKRLGMGKEKNENKKKKMSNARDTTYFTTKCLQTDVASKVEVVMSLKYNT
jgi:hypothetical protein